MYLEMKRVLNGLVLLIIALSVCSCGTEEQKFFRFGIKAIDGTCPVSDIETADLGENQNAVGPDCLVRDSVVISQTRSEYLFDVSEFGSGDLLGSYCRRGRAWNEPLSALPLYETYVKSRDLCADIFSFMDSKLFVWNITQSLAQHRDVYDEIVRIKDADATGTPWMSFYRIDSTKIIAYNSMQLAASPDAEYAPRYEIYDVANGEKLKELDLFNAVDLETGSDMFTSKMFLSNVDCIKPDRTKLFFAMSYMPVYGVLDIKEGKAVGYRVKGLVPFSPKEQRWHFADVQADDDNVYALYSGELMFSENGTDIPNILYVIGWDGALKKKFVLNGRFTQISLDNGHLYLRNPAGVMAEVKTATLDL